MQQVIAPVGKIHMVDLKGQYMALQDAIDTAIRDCIHNAAFIKGPQVAQFEKELAAYLDTRYAVGCGNGTDALQIAMMALGLQPGDEVVVPAFTYVAATEVIALLGLTPVMVDVDPDTFNISRAILEEAISPKTRLVVPVHLFGQCSDMEGIVNCCRQNNLFIVEDTAQAIGSQYTFSDGTVRSAGAIGNIGTTSFFPSKNLGCYGDGGALYTDDGDLAQLIRMIGAHGQGKKYLHDVIGVNSRLDTLQAAVLLEKLKHLRQYEQARQKAAAQYDVELAGLDAVEVPYRAPYATHVFHQYTIKVPAAERDALKAYLQEKGIPSMVYYPLPLSRQKAYQGMGRTVGELPVAHELCQRVLSLPMHTELPEDQISYISENIRTFFQN